MNIETLLTDEEIKKAWHIGCVNERAYEKVKAYIAKAQEAKTKRVIAEWLMNYIDINLEEIIPDDKYTLFFIPNNKLKAIKKWALGK